MSRAILLSSLTLLCGSLIALSPYQLGQGCATYTMKGVIHILTMERFGMVEDREIIGTYHNIASKYVLNAVDLEKVEVRAAFLQGMVDYLRSIDCKKGVEVESLSQYDCAKVAFVKYLSIDKLEKALAAKEALIWGERLGRFHQRILIQGFPIYGSDNEIQQSTAVALSKALAEVYGQEVTTEAVLAEIAPLFLCCHIEPNFTEIGLILKDIMHRDGIYVHEFVRKVFSFAPVDRICQCKIKPKTASACTTCCHPAYYLPWLESLEDGKSFEENAAAIEARYYTDMSINITRWMCVYDDYESDKNDYDDCSPDCNVDATSDCCAGDNTDCNYITNDDIINYW